MRTGAPIHGWRKIAVSTWRAPTDPQIYADLDLDATAMLGYLDAARRRAGVQITLTHLVAKGVAHTLALSPDLNGRLHRGRFVPRESIDVFVAGAAANGSAFTGMLIRNADDRSVIEIATDVTRAARPGGYRSPIQLSPASALLSRLPPRLLRTGLRTAAWGCTDLDISRPRRTGPRHPFGSAMVISAGIFGVDHAYAPLSPYYQVPFLVLVGDVTMRPVAVEGRILPRPMVTLTATLDHRYADGFHAARIVTGLRQYCQHPEAFEPPLPDKPPSPPPDDQRNRRATSAAQ